MKKHIYDSEGIELLETIEAEPVCGVDFCDTCGDCLHCSGGDECYHAEDGEHLWIEYKDETEHPN